MASYVEHGAAAVGIVGLDILREEPRDLYEPLDLGIGRRRASRPRSSRCTVPSRSPLARARRRHRGHHRDRETAEANGLVIEEEVLEVSARLVVNRVALKLHAERLRRLIAALRRVCADGSRRSPLKARMASA